MRENISIGFLKKLITFFYSISIRKEKVVIDKTIKILDIKTPSMEVPVLNLSGGNQQKCVLGRSIEAECPILVMEEPTFGVDIQVKAEIHRIMFDIVKRGSSIILVADDLFELTKMCDRIIVLAKGIITREFRYGEIDNIELASVIGSSNE
jgi:ABC-type sugar transport system ATPase subunit